MKKLLYISFGIVLFLSCTKDEEAPQACFTYTSNFIGFKSGPIPIKDCVVFENCSQNATSYLWNFGDGSTSEEKNPYHIYEGTIPIIVSLTAYNGAEHDVFVDTVYDGVVAYKPNIYLYPTQTTELCVTLDFPKGGSVIASIPDYNDGWCVTVEPSGLVDGVHNYLFYESLQPNIWQRNQGWCISKREMESFFTQNMQQVGFNVNEIADFISYWIPKLSDTDYYLIYPQNSAVIESVIRLNFTVSPQQINRLFYVIEKSSIYKPMDEPWVDLFIKEGFYVNEWGVIL